MMLCSVGKVPDDSVLLGDLKLKPGLKIMMMGTREEEIVSTIRNSHIAIKY